MYLLLNYIVKVCLEEIVLLRSLQLLLFGFEFLLNNLSEVLFEGRFEVVLSVLVFLD